MKKLLFCLLCFSLLTFGSSAKIIEVAPAGAWGTMIIGGSGVAAVAAVPDILNETLENNPPDSIVWDTAGGTRVADPHTASTGTYARSFDSDTGDYLIDNDYTVFQSFFLDMWFKLEETEASDGGYIAIADVSAAGVCSALRMQISDRGATFAMYPKVDGTQKTDHTISVDTWYHLQCSYNASTYACDLVGEEVPVDWAGSTAPCANMNQTQFGAFQSTFTTAATQLVIDSISVDGSEFISIEE